MNDKEKEEFELGIEAKYVDKTEKEFLSRVTFTECIYILTPKNKYGDKIRELSVLKICEIMGKLQKENEEWQRAYQEEKDRQFDLIKENEELKNKLKEKDKIINLTVNHIATSDSYLCQYLDITTKCKYYAGENGNTCDECIKQYFERQAENDTKCT